MSTRHVRPFSAKGRALYEERIDDFRKRCSASWRKVTESLCIVGSLTYESNVGEINLIEQQLPMKVT